MRWQSRGQIFTLTVFVSIAVFDLREPMGLRYLWAGLCLSAAASFIFGGGLVRR